MNASFGRILGPLAVVLGVLPASGCSIPLEDQAPMVLNRCGSASDCGPDATCADDGRGATTCVATAGDLTGLLVEVRPATATSGTGEVQAGAGYLLRPEDVGTRVAGTELGGVISWDANLPPLVDIVDGRVRAYAKDDACAAAAGASMPADVFFTRFTPEAGLPSAEYHTTTTIAGPDDHTFAISLPAGRYDVYVQPQLPPVCTTEEPPPCCALPLPPPYFIRDLAIDPGNTKLNIPLPEQIKLSGQVSTGLDISDWTIALVDRRAGKLISTEPILLHDPLLKIAQYELYYHPTSGPEPYQPPWVRVRAPEPDYSPVILWGLEDVDLDGNSEVDLSIADTLTNPVPVQAQILASDERTTVESNVTLIGTFPGAPNVLFERTLQTLPDGSFSTQLFPASQTEPAHYKCFARPANDDTIEAIGVSGDWEIRADEECFCGHTVLLPERTVVSAQVSTQSGQPLDAPVAATQSADAADLVAPRPVNSEIVAGSLSLRLDPGTFDVTVKPTSESGFPWLVTSQLQIPADQATTALGSLEVPFPVVLRGRVLDAMGAPVPHASITGWLPVVDPEDESSSVVQIGETVSDADGSFVLLLPPKLTH